jgi:NADH-quinone oxidoreductase subunit N
VVAVGLWLLAVVAAGNAVLGVAVYLRWLRLLLGPVPGEEAPAAVGQPVGTPTATETAAQTPAPEGVRRRVHPAVLIAVALTFAALVLTSLAPDLLLHLLG